MTCTDGKVIVFFQNMRNKESLDLFIEELINKRNKYLREEYLKVDLDFPLEDNLYRIKWLRDNEIIDGEEFNKVKGIIMKRDMVKSKLD